MGNYLQKRKRNVTALEPIQMLTLLRSCTFLLFFCCPCLKYKNEKENNHDRISATSPRPPNDILHLRLLLRAAQPSTCTVIRIHPLPCSKKNKKTEVISPNGPLRETPCPHSRWLAHFSNLYKCMRCADE